MPVLISSSKGNGERRCDAKCYDAMGGDCDCICGGRNHGVGIGRAVENSRELALSILAKYGGEVLYQLPLPGVRTKKEVAHAGIPRRDDMAVEG